MAVVASPPEALPQEAPDNTTPPDAVVERYAVQHQVGQGAYGAVFLARCRSTDRQVALKQLALDEQDGVPATTLREVCALKFLSHPNIVCLLDVICSGAHLTLVFEYMERDLRSYIRDAAPRVAPRHMQDIFFQILVGVAYMHQQRFLHRDMKPQNVLIEDDLTCKICDFGLARVFGFPGRPLTREVVTVWYRAPEILLGSQTYSTAVDMWSCGCILGELATGKALFNGEYAEIGTIMKIFELCGTPTVASWPKLAQLPLMSPNFPKWRGNIATVVKKSAPQLGQEGQELLELLLVCCPDARLHARKAALHPFFRNLDITRYDTGHLLPAPAQEPGHAA